MGSQQAKTLGQVLWEARQNALVRYKGFNGWPWSELPQGQWFEPTPRYQVSPVVSAIYKNTSFALFKSCQQSCQLRNIFHNF